MSTRQSGYEVLPRPWIPAIPVGEGKWIEAPELQSRETRFASSERIQTKAPWDPFFCDIIGINILFIGIYSNIPSIGNLETCLIVSMILSLGNYYSHMEL